MNSQVRNTLTILVISSALVLGLVVAPPAGFHAGQATIAQDGSAIVTSIDTGAVRASEDAMITSLPANLPARAPVLAGLATTLQDASTSPADAKPAGRKSGQSSRIRQSMAMPFFSFAPRG